MAILKLYLLGPPRVEIDDQPLTIRRRKGLALLIYLAVTRQTYSRDALATLFFPEQSQKRARAYLRRDLAALNTTLPGQWLAADRESVGLQPEAEIWLDVAQFREQLALCETHSHPPSELCADCVSLLRTAANLYMADFLSGFNLPDCPDFDEWQFFQAEELRQDLTTTLEKLVQNYITSAQEDFETAISYARRWVALDPLHEPAQRQLMRLYAQAGHQAAALRQYEECVRLLDEEFGLPPEEETTTLYEAIKAKRLIDPLLRAQAQQKVTGNEQPTSHLHNKSYISAKRPTPPANLPSRSTQFIGREQELNEIRRLLVDEPNCRLLSLVGPGGMGKTRLAVEAATHLGRGFDDGVHFVSLVSVDEVAFIVSAIAETLKLNFQGETNPKTQLLHHLAQKNYLLIIDNIEHLLAAAISAPQSNSGGEDLLIEMLDAAPYLKLLVTSRERLNLQEEWGYEVSGMSFPQKIPTHGIDPQVVASYPAIQLFLQRARQADATFACSNEDIAAIVRICRLVGGMPLGIELAAPWVRSMSCPEIADEIERNFDLLATTLRNVPERHRSMRVIFEQTWQHLTPTEQAVFAKLSIFRGGCLREAAREVAGATLPDLTSLIDKALLRHTRNGRYEMHELIRQFAAQQLTQNPDTYDATRDRHSAYYMRFLQQHTPNIKADKQKEALSEITADIDNIRLAWSRAIANRNVSALSQAAECLWLFNEFQGSLQEGEAAFQQALNVLLPDRNPLAVVDQEKTPIGFLLAAEGGLHGRLGGLVAGRQMMEQGIALMRQSPQPDRQKEAFALAWLGFILVVTGNQVEAWKFAHEAFNLFPETGDKWCQAGSLRLLGASAYLQGDLAEAQQRLQSCLAVSQEIGEQRVRTYASLTLGQVMMAQGEYEQARSLWQQALIFSQALNDLLGNAYVRRELGRLYLAEGQPTKAEEFIRHSLTAFGDMGSRWDVTATQGYLAMVLQRDGKYGEAENLYQQTLVASQEMGHLGLAGQILSNLGQLAYDQQDYQQAKRYQQEALAICNQIGNEPEIATVHRHLGHVAVAHSADDQAKARRHYKQALDLSIKHKLAPIALDVFVGVAELLRQQGQIQQAVELLSLAKHHPASTFETKVKTHQFPVDLSPGLSDSGAERAVGWSKIAAHISKDLA